MIIVYNPAVYIRQKYSKLHRVIILGKDAEHIYKTFFSTRRLTNITEKKAKALKEEINNKIVGNNN